MSNKDKQQYLLLDSRAGTLSASMQVDELSELDKDWSRYILYVGSRKSTCKYANNRLLGDNCVVATMDGVVQWEMFHENGWR